MEHYTVIVDVRVMAVRVPISRRDMKLHISNHPFSVRVFKHSSTEIGASNGILNSRMHNSISVPVASL
jgi:hypothetical protein